ncbi:hypothetical protein CRG98_000643 [Punica granatum]|uniref:Uncharacterized protein n=1 Tax=Punica granatum TaxID=22663 RepID=A0A2I0LE93_PUNGR|nr:hypothetical protein CRG98_000643 [Punica granatum]
MSQPTRHGAASTITLPIEERTQPTLRYGHQPATGATRTLLQMLFYIYLQFQTSSRHERTIQGALGQSRRRPIGFVGPVRLACPSGTQLLELSLGRLRMPTRNQGEYTYAAPSHGLTTPACNDRILGIERPSCVAPHGSLAGRKGFSHGSSPYFLPHHPP